MLIIVLNMFLPLGIPSSRFPCISDIILQSKSVGKRPIQKILTNQKGPFGPSSDPSVAPFPIVLCLISEVFATISVKFSLRPYFHLRKTSPKNRNSSWYPSRPTFLEASAIPTKYQLCKHSHPEALNNACRGAILIEYFFHLLSRHGFLWPQKRILLFYCISHFIC